MSKIVKLFKDTYSLSMGSKKWISKGSDLLRYIGQNIIQVKFSKNSETDPWESVAVIVRLVGITDFEPLTGTYLMTWESTDGKDSKQENCRVTPEGFSFGIPEKDLWMYRFLPMSLHVQMTEAIYAYDRFKRLYESRPSLEEKEIESLCRDKQVESLERLRYISLIVDTDVPDGLGVGICETRLSRISRPQLHGKYWMVAVHDSQDNYIILRIPRENPTEAFKLSIDKTFIGNAKLIDLQE